jgi:hypothetical protein
MRVCKLTSSPIKYEGRTRTKNRNGRYKLFNDCRGDDDDEH